jgi:hypothetical protein
MRRAVPPLFHASTWRGAWLIKTKTKLRGFSPQVNYTDRAAVACRRSECQVLQI